MSSPPEVVRNRRWPAKGKNAEGSSAGRLLAWLLCKQRSDCHHAIDGELSTLFRAQSPSAKRQCFYYIAWTAGFQPVFFLRGF